MQPFEVRPRKVHLFFDHKGRMFRRGGSASRTEVDNTLCAGNHGMNGMLTTTKADEVTCLRCLKLMQNPAFRRGLVEMRHPPAVQSPPSRPIDFYEPSRLTHNHSIPMVLFCPLGHRHIDEKEFADKPHHTHACQECGIVWRPAKVNTHGVRFLPGYKND